MNISVFVDAANFFYMQRDRLHWWIDPKKLLDFVKRKSDILKGINDNKNC